MAYRMTAEGGKSGRKRWFPPPANLLPPAGLALAGWVLWLMVASLVAAPARGDELTRLVNERATEEIRQYARRRGWVNYRYDVQAWVPGDPDNRPLCRQPVLVQPAQSGGRHWGRVPYAVSCPDPAWELRARADVSLSVPVVVARRNLARDELLTRETMMLREVDLAGVYGDFITDIRMLTGQRARRAIRSGQVITLSQATAPLMVSRGDQVLIRVEGNGVQASMTGEALQDGSKGQSIRVRNHSSGRVVTAWVVDRGIVETRF